MSLAAFLILPVTYQELYKCPENAEVCIDLYSSEVTTPQFKALISTLSGDAEETGLHTLRNASIFLVPLGYFFIVSKLNKSKNK